MQAASPPGRLRRREVAAVFAVAAAVFLASPARFYSDSLYTMLVAHQVATRGSFDLAEHFRAPLDPARFPGSVAGGLPHQVEERERDGRRIVTYAFPFGTALLAAPVAAVAAAAGSPVVDDGLGGYVLRRDRRLQRYLAALLAAAFVAMVYLAARSVVARGTALAVAAAAGLATPVWSNLSRSLWSQTACLFVLGLALPPIVRLATGGRASGAWLGALLGLAYWMRPTAAIAIVAVGLWLAVVARDRWPGFAAGLAASLAGFVAISWSVWGTALPPYFAAERVARLPSAGALAGVLVSPNRGLLVAMPFVAVLFAAACARRDGLAGRGLAGLAAAGVAAHVLVVASFPHWWGGHSYGPRLLAESAFFLALAAVAVLPALAGAAAADRRWRRALAATALLAALFQAGGALTQAGGRWNSLPVDVDRAPERIWDWRDPQYFAWALRAPDGEPTASSAATSPVRVRNVVVLMVDTLRADHLSLHGYERPTSPRLDRLARESGVVFENARSSAPCTFPSINSILTSRSPLVFVEGASRQFLGIPPALPSLPTILSRAGFATAAVSASPIFTARRSKENPHGGFGGGFDRFDESCRWRDARCVTRRARRALAGLREPFLLYVHYMDPHDPYRRRPGDAPRFAADEPGGVGREFVRDGDPIPVAARIYGQGLDPDLSPAELAYLVARYDDEIAHWDEWALPVFRALARRGIDGRTAVAVIADHGESFLEHGDVTHCRSLYDTELRVPFVLFVPGAVPRRVAAPVSTLDLVPTLLDLLGVPASGAGLEGRTLVPELLGLPASAAAGARLQRSWWSGQRSVSDGRFKLVASADRQALRLFDLERDAGETTDRYEADRAAASPLAEALGEWTRAEPEPGAARVDEIERQLRALGYLR